ncbi:helix-turn-helix transcriptional regulator [Ovoidimarina sediminis]|uniref:helix-turn-helix transcriptional regulator n=1 Tax=Ovoidimarina sediminis TaxID=3079856 RepID=UPI00290D63A2|nr:LuxR C-terminal-related transcriptional regulator [Rhodophyticola sp. MJ-SS7]MDU8943615.1 LuxR C-terminal-related transcriptional regulator [Rhodophyticola sp. MJ-SS7]
MLIEKAAALESQNSADAVWAFALGAFRAAGLPHVIYIMTNAERTNLELRTNIPQLYTATDPGQDPFLDYCCHSYEPTRTGIAYLPDYGYLPDSAQRFIRGAEKVGFRSGFGLPMHLEGSPRFGGFNIGCGLSRDAFEDRFAPLMSDVQAFCFLVHRRLGELAKDPGHLMGGLSPREREILTLICNGASRKETAKELNLSPHTVAEYSKSAYRKLGVKNRAEAARHVFGQ